MASLKNLTRKEGVTVLSVIHQPRKTIFESFDSVILLGVGGNMIYHGPVMMAQKYFANIQPPYFLPEGESVADWLIDVSSGRLLPDRPASIRREKKKRPNTSPEESAEEEEANDKDVSIEQESDETGEESSDENIDPHDAIVDPINEESMEADASQNDANDNPGDVEAMESNASHIEAIADERREGSLYEDDNHLSEQEEAGSGQNGGIIRENDAGQSDSAVADNEQEQVTKNSNETNDAMVDEEKLLNDGQSRKDTVDVTGDNLQTANAESNQEETIHPKDSNSTQETIQVNSSNDLETDADNHTPDPTLSIPSARANAKSSFVSLNDTSPGKKDLRKMLVHSDSGSSVHSSVSIDFDDDEHAGALNGPSTAKFEQSVEAAKERRQQLYNSWNKYYKELSDSQRAIYDPPEEYPLPTSKPKPRFFTQLRAQLRRNMLFMWRNRVAKLVDTVMIVVAVLLISFLEGPLVVARRVRPRLTFDELVAANPVDVATTFPELFQYALRPTTSMIEYALKVGVIAAVLLGLAAAKAVTGKRLEFFRESASGWSVGAYFMALNITSTFEHAIQMVLCAMVAYWLRDSVANYIATLTNYIMLMWLVVSWALFIPLLVPPGNAVLAVGFFMAFFGLLFSGGLDPITYEDIYNSEIAAILCGFISPTRYFIEGVAVQEQRAMPVQSGYTVNSTSVNFPVEFVGGFTLVGLAQNDSSVVQHSYNGWQWYILPALFVGLTVRLMALGALHLFDRPKQNRKGLFYEMRQRPSFRNRISLNVYGFLVVLAGMFYVSIIFINLDYGSDGIMDVPQNEEEMEDFANMVLQDAFPDSNVTVPPGFFSNSSNATVDDFTDQFNSTDPFNVTDSEDQPDDLGNSTDFGNETVATEPPVETIPIPNPF